MNNRIVRAVLRIQNRWLRKNRFLTRLLFNANVRNCSRIHWDFTTLILKRALDRLGEIGPDVLEIGTGPHALLSIYLYRKIRPRITATDINDEYVALAAESAKFNGAEIRFLQSDLFEKLSGSFDLIFWNAVYISRGDGEKYGVASLHGPETDWCGGESGYEVVERFLMQAKSRLKNGGRILLGYNRFYLHNQKVEHICRKNGLTVNQTFSGFLNPSVAALISIAEEPLLGRAGC
jgi:HemK-related putative methylase